MSKIVWYISKYAVPKEKGSPTRQYFLSKNLANLGYKVTLIFSRSSLIFQSEPRKYKNEITLSEGFRQVMLDGPIINLGFNLKRVLSWIGFEIRLFFWIFRQTETPDTIIVSSLSILTFLTGVIFKKIFKCKLIVEVRDIYPYTLIATGRFNKKNIFVRLLSSIEKIGYKNANYIISTVSSFDNYLYDYYGIYIDKYVHLPMGVDLQYYENSLSKVPYEARTNFFNFPDNKFVVAYVGSFGFINNTKIIADLINRFSSHQDVLFVFAGNGPEKEKFLKQIERNNNYIDLGNIKKYEIPLCLSRCNVAIHPILNLEIYKYGLSPNKWMDYMYSAIPFIVCFNGNISMLKSAGCASIIPSEDIDRLESEIFRFMEMIPEERKKMGLMGKKYLVENLTYEKHAKTLSTLI